MIKRGFSIAELLIVITIMGILLVLGVVNMTSTQANSRDAERKSDAETIAISLETYYTSSQILTDGTVITGRYPSTTDMADKDKQKATLRDMDIKALYAPGQSTDATNTSLIMANYTNTPSTVSINNYIYQPLYLNTSGVWALCSDATTQKCRKFNLYYTNEVGVAAVQTITSKNQ